MAMFEFVNVFEFRKFVKIGISIKKFDISSFAHRTNIDDWKIHKFAKLLKLQTIFWPKSLILPELYSQK
jgi:hypothetical protein